MKNIINEICKELEIECTFFSEDWCCLLTKGKKEIVISGYKFPLNDHAAGLIADDKYALYELLKMKNIPVIEHKILFSPNNEAEKIKNKESVFEYFKKNNNALVVKPNNGTCGNGVMRIYDKDELLTSIDELFSANYSISLCPYYDIDTEYRVIILNGKVKCIYGKKRPILYGDGTSTIRSLLTNFNPSYFKKESRFFNKKIDLDYIPKKNEIIEYNWQFNLAKGSQVISEIESSKKNKILNIALKAYKASKLKFCSVDVALVKDDYLIMEINSGVTIKRYIDLVPNGYEIAKTIYRDAIKSLFKIN